MKIDKEQLFELLQKQKFKWVKIFDSDGDKVYSVTDANASSESVVNGIRDFLSISKENKLRLDLKINSTDSADNITKYTLLQSLESPIAKEAKENPALNLEEIEAKMEKKILARIETEKEKELIQNLKKELEEKHKAIEAWAGKAQLLIEMALTGLVKKYEPVIQGFMNPQMQPIMNGVPETEATEQTEIQEALGIILQYLSPTQLKNLALNVQKNPALIQTLKTFNLI